MMVAKQVKVSGMFRKGIARKTLQVDETEVRFRDERFFEEV